MMENFKSIIQLKSHEIPYVSGSRISPKTSLVTAAIITGLSLGWIHNEIVTLMGNYTDRRTKTIIVTATISLALITTFGIASLLRLIYTDYRC